LTAHWNHYGSGCSPTRAVTHFFMKAACPARGFCFCFFVPRQIAIALCRISA